MLNWPNRGHLPDCENFAALVICPPRMMMCRHKLEEQEEIMMESDEEGLLATNLIEELVGSELGFQLRYVIFIIFPCNHATSVFFLT